MPYRWLFSLPDYLPVEVIIKYVRDLINMLPTLQQVPADLSLVINSKHNTLADNA
jgi:hypothetical protein